MSNKLQGKIAIVTGGGRGIGRAIAEAYANNGAKVVVTVAIQKDEIDETALKINGKAILADITKPGDVQMLVDSVIAEFGRIDILVNNAARGMRFVNESFMTEPKPFWEADASSWQMVVNTLEQLKKGSIEATYGFAAESSRASREQLEEIFKQMNPPM